MPAPSVPTGTGPGTLSYLLADHLGSTVGALDAAGNSLGTQAYWPFGAARSQTGGVATDKLYTSQQREALTTPQTPLQGATDALGTYFYHARFYSPVTGRFMSADSIAVDGLNRYSYVVNDPVNYTDPSGHCILGQECNEETISWYIHCALTCGDNAAGQWARSALRSETFWENVLDKAKSQHQASLDYFLSQVLIDIAADVSETNFWAVGEGFESMAKWFGTSAAFFAATFLDFALGSHLIRRLPDQAFIGGRPWWSNITFNSKLSNPVFRARLSGPQVAWLQNAEGIFIRLTRDRARNLIAANPGHILNDDPWSPEQRDILHFSGLEVDLAPSEPDAPFPRPAPNPPKPVG